MGHNQSKPAAAARSKYSTASVLFIGIPTPGEAAQCVARNLREGGEGGRERDRTERPDLASQDSRGLDTPVRSSSLLRLQSGVEPALDCNQRQFH